MLTLQKSIQCTIKIFLRTFMQLRPLNEVYKCENIYEIVPRSFLHFYL